MPQVAQQAAQQAAVPMTLQTPQQASAAQQARAYTRPLFGST